MARILSVTACWLPERVDGTIVTAGRLAEAWARQGHETLVFCRRLGSFAPIPVIDPAMSSMTREVIGDSLVLRAEVPRERLFTGGLDHPDVPALFASVLDELKPDAVHIHHLENLSIRIPEIALARGVPTVITLHDFHLVCPTVQLIGNGRRPCASPDAGRACARCWPASARAVDRPGSALGRFRRLADVVFARNAHAFRGRYVAAMSALESGAALVSPSRYLADTLGGIARLPASRIEIIGNGADETPSLRPCASGAAPVIGFMGNLQRAKGPHLLTEALAGIADLQWSLRIHGDGTPAYRSAVMRLAPSGRSAWLGAYAPEDASAILQGLDLLVVPSTWPENSPLVVWQALAAGVPCVVAGWGGLAELVRDGVDGAHFKPGDALSLRAVLRRLIERPQTILDLAQRVRERRPRRWSDVADDYAHVFRRLGADL